MTQDSWQILFQLLEVSQQGTQALQLPGESVKCMQRGSWTRLQKAACATDPAQSLHLDFTRTDVICKQLTYLSSPARQTQSSSGRCLQCFNVPQRKVCSKQNFHSHIKTVSFKKSYMCPFLFFSPNFQKEILKCFLIIRE